MKCNICGFEKEVWKSIKDDSEVLCLNPDKQICPGIMINVGLFRDPPTLSKEAVPTRNMDASTKFSTKKKDIRE